jgi:5-methylcytosine-specific restriction protein A
VAQLQDIKPCEFLRVIDLASEAEIDVSDWENFRNGPNPARASTNPKYCYEWAFVERGKVVVLCLWYGNMREKKGEIFQEGNAREFAIKMTDEGNHSVSARSRRFDSALQTAARDQLPVRVIVVDRESPEKWYLNPEKSQPKKRLLDPESWSVAAYDPLTGAYTVIRGNKVKRFIDQFDVLETEGEPEKRQYSVEVYNRDPEVRRQALERAGGECEYCGQSGFIMADGGIFLESHHVIPLHENGNDLLSNVAALCPNHHREAHHGKNKVEIRETLLRKLKSSP